MAIDWSAARKKAKELDKETAKLTKQPSSTGRGGGTASAPKNKKPVSRNGGASPMKDSGGTKTTTTTLLPTKDNASSWVSETRSKGANQANRDRMGQMFGLTMPSATKPNAYLEQKAQERQERRRKSARSELSSLLSQTVTEENRDDLTARIRAAQQTLNETKPERKTRSLAGSFALGTENVVSGVLRGVEAPAAAVDSAFWTLANAATQLPLIRSIPGMDKAQAATADYAARAQTLPISTGWQKSIQERYQPNQAEQTVGDWESNIASYIPSLGLSAGIGAAAGAGQGAAALTAADTAAKGQRAGQLMMALQGMGSAAKEARDEGATTAQANLYGAADGLLGAATERISGGIPLLGSGVADRVVSKFATLPLDRAVADMAGEGFEEGLQTAAEPLLKRAIYDPDARNATLSEIGQSAAMGALASGALKLGIEAPQAVESGIQRFRAERSRGRAADAPAPSEQGQTVQTKPVQSQTSAEAQQVGTIRVGQSDVPLYDRIPDGWKRTKGAQTAPRGYVWVDNNKSMFGGERQSGMVPESAVRPEMGQYRQGAANESGADAPAVPDMARSETAAQAEPSTAVQSPQTGRPIGPESSVGAAEKGFDPWSAFQGTKSQFYPEGPNAARPVDVPTTDANGDQVRKSASTIMGARAVTDETAGMVQDMVRQGRFSYTKVGDDASVQQARQTIERDGFQRSLEKYAQAVRNGTVSKDMVTLGQQLLINASNAGDGKVTAELLTLYGQSSTNTAQALQAQSILRKMDPEYQLYAVQKTVDRLNEDVQRRQGDKLFRKLQTAAKDITIDPDLLTKYLQAEDQAGRDAVMEEIYQNVADQVPSNWEDKWRAWRYFSMLSAPRTHGRNLVGNAGGQLMRVAKDEIAAGIEAVVSRASGGKLQRTKTFGAAPSLYEAAAADFQNVAEDLSGSHFDDVKGQIQDRRTIFKKGRLTRGVEKAVQTVSGNKEFQFKRGALEAATKGNSALLGAEDTLFKKATYADALAKFLQANHVTAEQFRSGQVDPDLVARGRDYASREAMKHTFNDHNDFSDAVASLGSRGAHSENAWVRRFSRAVEAVLPFKRTPANILVRGAEYSPAGLAKSLTVDLVKVKQGKMSGAEAIDNIAQGLTGTGVMLLGALLAKSGLLTGSADSDEEEAKMDELTGGQDYALNLPGGRNATLDWLAPASLPLFMGVEMYNATAERDGTDAADSALAFLGNSLKVAAKTADPMLEMTMLQSLNDILTNHSYDDGSPLGRLVASAATSYVTQALPSILGQLGRTLQDKRYTTYTNKNVTFPTTDMQYTLGKTIARLPGSDKFPVTNQVPYIDAWGREEKTGTLPERAFNNFLNPAYVSRKNETAVDKEIRRLYRATGDNSVVPDRFEKSVSIDGKKVWLDQDQYVAAAKKAGQAKYDALDKLIATDAYQKADDARKAELVDDIMEYGNAMGRMAVTDWKPAQSSWVSKAVEAEKSGIDIGTYVLYHETKDADGDGTVSQSEAAGVLLPMKGLTDAQKSALWKATDRGWNPEKDPFQGTLPTKGGLSVEQSVKVLQTYRDIDKADYTGDKVASQKQTAFSKALDGMGLTKDQRTVVDDTYKFWTMMPAKVQAYSVDTMSEAAQKHWPALKALDMSEAAYLQVYPIVAKSEKGYGKEQKLRDLMALGYSRSQANTIYSKIQSK